MVVIPDELVRRWVNAGQPRIDSYMDNITGMIIRCYSDEGRLKIIGGPKRIQNQEGPNF